MRPASSPTLGIGRRINPYEYRCYTVTYYDDQGNLLDTDKFNSGTKLNSQDAILSCSGQVETTLQGLGDVRAVYEFKGFLTTPTG